MDLAKVHNKPAKIGKSIHQCFIILGADKEDIYSPKSLKHTACPSNLSIYDRYDNYYLLAWARELWLDSARIYHEAGSNPDEKMMAVCNMAYRQIKRIVGYRIKPPRFIKRSVS